MLDRLAALLNLDKKTLRAAGFSEPDGTLVSAARSLGYMTKDPKYAHNRVMKHIQGLFSESLAAANLAATLLEPSIALSTNESPGPAVEEEFKTLTAQRQRAEGSGVKPRRGRRPLAVVTLRLGTNAVRTLVRQGELTSDEGQMFVAELQAAAI